MRREGLKSLRKREGGGRSSKRKMLRELVSALGDDCVEDACFECLNTIESC